MATGYKVTATQATAYTDENNQFREGFKVFFNLPDFGENHFIYTPSLDPQEVKRRIETFLANRKNLATL